MSKAPTTRSDSKKASAAPLSRADRRAAPAGRGPVEAGSGRAALPGWLRRAALLLLPALIYLAGVLLLGDWIIDDAGISYAYAKNVALGHGFVAEPGRPPVEGYSNFLWVMLLVPLRALRLFDPVVIPKILGAAFVLGALLVVQRTFERRTGRWEPGLFAALWIACAPPIAIWTGSGLENGLMLLLVVALWARAVEQGRLWQAQCGLLAALAAMTHPEGLVYLGFALGASVAGDLIGAERRVARAVRSAGLCLAGFLLLFAPFLVFRLMVFGRPWPQPYYAKRAHGSFATQLADLARHPEGVLARIAEAGRAFAGPAGPWVLAAMLLAIGLLAWSGRLRRPVALAAWLCAIALAASVLIDPDWMGEHRFATGAIAALAITLGGLLFAGRGLGGSTGTRPGGSTALAAAAALSAVFLASAGPRLLRFAENPTTPYRDVQRRVAERFAAYAEFLGVPRPSILVQDVGAVLDQGRLRVHDVTGLVDPEATRTLRAATAAWQPDHPEFYDWVFEEIRPTFIATRGFWCVIPAYENDPRFVRDYAPIESYVDGYILRHHKLVLHSGDYVRRDALKGETEVEALRSRYRAEPRQPTPGWRLADAWERLSQGEPSLQSLRDQATRMEAEAKDLDRAAALYAAVLEREPEDEGALLGLARSLDWTGRAYEARPVWIRLRDLERGKGSATDAQLVQFIDGRLGDPRHRLPFSTVAEAQWVRIGERALYQEHAYDAAIRLFREVLEVDASHYGASCQLARALTAAGRRAEAAKAWAAVVPLAEQRGDRAVVAEAQRAARASGAAAEAPRGAR